MKDSRKD